MIEPEMRLNVKANDELIRKHEIAEEEEKINTKIDISNDLAVEKWADEFIAKDDLSYMSENQKKDYKRFLIGRKKQTIYNDHYCAVLALTDVHNWDCLIDELGGGPQD